MKQTVKKWILWAVALFKDDAGKIPDPLNRTDRRARQSIARRRFFGPVQEAKK